MIKFTKNFCKRKSFFNVFDAMYCIPYIVYLYCILHIVLLHIYLYTREFFGHKIAIVTKLKIALLLFALRSFVITVSSLQHVNPYDGINTKHMEAFVYCYAMYERLSPQRISLFIALYFIYLCSLFFFKSFCVNVAI